MRTDHRRPLVAYLLVSLAGAFVMAQSLGMGGTDGDKPSFSAFSDTMLTPSEKVIDPSNSNVPVPDSGPVEEPEAEEDSDGGSLVPAVDAITDSMDVPLVTPVGTGAAAGSDDTATDQGGTDGDDAPVADPPRADLVVSGGSSGNGNGNGSSNNGSSDNGNGFSGDGTGGPSGHGTGGPSNHAPEDDSGIFDGVPPGGGPVTDPGDGDGDGPDIPIPDGDGDHGNGDGDHGHGDGDGDGDGDHGHGHGDGDGDHGDGDGDGDHGDHGDGDGDGDGDENPAPHSFDDVPPGAHPYGLVGPRPGNGPKDHGSKNHGSKNHGSKNHGSKDKARGHDQGHGKAHRAKGPKQAHRRGRH